MAEGSEGLELQESDRDSEALRARCVCGHEGCPGPDYCVLRVSARLHQVMILVAGVVLVIAMFLHVFGPEGSRELMAMLVVLVSGFLFGKFTNNIKGVSRR
ncbi:MAG: hypothetical protein RMJ43_03280 [Chloroherpetonaceae bacterium]|nr:hypothetical protein [Chloroherpetonaceae bacterium]